MQKKSAPESHLAYEDAEFLASDDARPLRILAEYLDPLRRFRRQRIHDTIVFFGSARLDPNGPFGRRALRKNASLGAAGATVTSTGIT